MRTKNTIEVSAICRDCKKEFSAEVQFYYDSISIEEKARVLVETANENGGKDNIAVILVEPDSDEEA